jgi:hypothetical protein
MLEGGDRALDVGEGSLEMGEDLRGRPVCGIRRRPGQQLGRRAAPAQGRADVALCPVEPFPDALRRPITPPAIEGAAGGEDAMGDGALEEPPQSAGGQAEPPDFVGAPHAESTPATGPCLAIAAEDPPGANRLSFGAGFVESVQTAVLIQRADDLAMRAGHLLKLFPPRQPFALVAEKPSLFPHRNDASPKIAILPGWGGVMAGYDFFILGAGRRVSSGRSGFAEFPV